MGPSIQKEECKSSILRTNSQKNMEDSQMEDLFRCIQITMEYRVTFLTLTMVFST